MLADEEHDEAGCGIAGPLPEDEFVRCRCRCCRSHALPQTAREQVGLDKPLPSWHAASGNTSLFEIKSSLRFGLFLPAYLQLTRNHFIQQHRYATIRQRQLLLPGHLPWPFAFARWYKRDTNKKCRNEPGELQQKKRPNLTKHTEKSAPERQPERKSDARQIGFDTRLRV